MILRKLARKILGGRPAPAKAPAAPPAPVLQEYFFRLALSEIGIEGGEVEVDHYNATCTHTETGKVPLIFPEAYISRVAAMPKEKTQDYFFQGVISDKRAWLNNYENVRDSRYGRNPESKYNFDTSYFEGLCASRFALAPTGDCPWSYRFFEGIMSHCIPILGDEDEDIFAGDYVYLRHSDAKKYDAAACERNYRTFLAGHTLAGLGFGARS